MITINSKNRFQENIGARSIFIDEIVLDKPLDLEFLFSDGTRERHTIVSGSKFSSPSMTIEEVVFYNDNTVDVDLVYHYSRFLVYDEAKVIGDVNALTRFANLTRDGNRFFGGRSLPASGTGIYSQVAFYNPIGSQTNTYIDVLRLNAKGADVLFRSLNDAEYTIFLATALVIESPVINKSVGLINGNTKILISPDAVIFGADLKVSISSDVYGTPSALDYKNSPLKLSPGNGLVFVSGVANNGVVAFAEMWEEPI